MELREPTLDPIEEGRGSLGGGPANSDDNIFVHIATEVGAAGAGLEDKKSVNSLTTTSRINNGFLLDPTMAFCQEKKTLAYKGLLQF